MTDQPSLMQFPCDFIIKIIGQNKPTFQPEIIDIIHQHFPNTPDTAIRCQPSKENHYLALSVTVHAQTQFELDELYRALTKHPDIKMVL